MGYAVTEYRPRRCDHSDDALSQGLVAEDGTVDQEKVEELKRQRRESVPLRMLIEADDIANAIVYLSSDAGRAVTGQVMRVNAGLNHAVVMRLASGEVQPEIPFWRYRMTAGQAATSSTDGYGDPYVVVSCDAHAGPSIERSLRPYCPKQYPLEEFDDFTARRATWRSDPSGPRVV